MRLGVASVILIAGTVAATQAFAARPARVEIEGAEVREGPGPTFKVVEKLSKGTGLAVSNMATEGYYKTRTPEGNVGWISGETLSLAIVGDSAAPVTEAGPPPMSSEAIAPGGRRKFLRARFAGGMNFFSASELNRQLKVSAFKNGFDVAVELDFLLSQEVAFVFRVERVFKRAFGENVSTNDAFQWDVSSYPAMVGLDVQLSREGKIHTYFGVAAGLAVQTGIVSQGISFPEPRVTELGDHAFTGLAKLTASMQMSRVISLFAEAGYRYLTTKPITPFSTGNGDVIFQDSNGNYNPIRLDLSGGMVGLGVALAF